MNTYSTKATTCANTIMKRQGTNQVQLQRSTKSSSQTGSAKVLSWFDDARSPLSSLDCARRLLLLPSPSYSSSSVSESERTREVADPEQVELVQWDTIKRSTSRRSALESAT